MKTSHDELLELVRSRTEKRTEFNYGILTADRYVATVRDAIGLQACYSHLCRRDRGGWASFDDVMQKAANTLTYSHPAMEIETKEADLPKGLKTPKNALMVFRHVLTTSKKDRDGDILRTGGAQVDPKMLLLWQHVHTLPIGKMIGVASHTKDELQLYSCIVDMNELCHDSAVMIDNDMGRFSHGFRALDFLEIKSEKAREEGAPGGFDVKKFEILEESLVSVPANPDSETEEVLLSLVEGGKLTSGLMKDCAAGIRERRPLSVPVKLDVKLTVNGQEVKSHENEPGNEERGTGDEPGPSKEAEAVRDEEGEETKGTEDAEVKEESSYDPEFQKPYPNEHAQRLNSPDKYERIRRQNDKFGSGIHAIFGVTEDGKTELQAIRFSADKFSPEEAREWLEEHDYSTGGFEPAKKPKKQLIDDSVSGGSHASPPKPDYEEGKMNCPDCEYVGPGKGGKCPECGAKLLPKKDFVLQKLGRVLNKANESKIRDAVDDLDEAGKMEIPRGAKALVNQAKRSLKEVLASLGTDVGGDKESELNDAVALVLAKGSNADLSRLRTALDAIERTEKSERLVRQFCELIRQQ